MVNEELQEYRMRTARLTAVSRFEKARASAFREERNLIRQRLIAKKQIQGKGAAARLYKALKTKITYRKSNLKPPTAVINISQPTQSLLAHRSLYFT